MISPASGRALRRALALAAAVALGAPLAPAPAYAALETTTTAEADGAVAPPAVPSPAPDPAAGASEAGLAEAVARDLGMTLEEFNAAGEQGKRAAAESAVPETPAAPAPAAPEQGAGDAAAGRSGNDLRAASVEQLYRAYLREVGPAGLQAVAEADGRFIIRTGGVNEPQAEPQPATAADGTQENGAGPTPNPTPAPASADAGSGGRLSPSEFVEQYANVVLETGEPLAPEEDFFGGQGYRIDGGVVCSAGFSAFSADGKPVVLTAGHCADDGAARLAEVTLPAGDPAGGFAAENAVTGELGTFGVSQFGGPGNSRVADPENPGTPGNDIAVIDSIRADLDPLPATTTWEDATSLGTGSVKIVGMTSPFVGQAVCRSGRTAGWSCGTVDEVGIYIVGGGSGDPADLRSFSGFLSTSVQSSGGDSGGPWISGNYAVGTHSAGNSSDSTENFAVAATLEDSMSVLQGVQLRLFLNRPVLAGSLPAGPIAPGQRITGRLATDPATDVPAGTQVRVTFPGSEPFGVDVDATGNWTFSAPGSGTGFTAQTMNGFSRSEPSTFSTVPKPTVPKPAVPAPGGSGTGTPGAGGSPAASPPASAQGAGPVVLTPAPEPSMVAALPAAGPSAAAGPDGAAFPDQDAAPLRLADTGVSGLATAVAGAGVALLLGVLLLLVVRRGGRR
ncbi:putative S1 family peptidase [Arthrobacter globiformis NBRC 12137]|uniref:Putative S1 family peptidase n=1 Tax=Arthrobacter globiformis (strain ATCC 8010 / DSM 20124 / JCM 1332 / NBRC 12137 / NCIMB 8907 / NRRL B-2979 / 168) TaxID=1077972 RepID=H0QGS2_ARTG1|nr:S1 family peptidase [Arthrobacter globiformis]GAB12023.1 putative S1 family peptidase [Arthrobacter globiformis NBRC 12137]